MLVHASSGHKRAVEDILSQPAVQTRLADTKAAEEIRILRTFFDMLKKDPERAYYGFNVSVFGRVLLHMLPSISKCGCFTSTCLYIVFDKGVFCRTFTMRSVWVCSRPV